MISPETSEKICAVCQKRSVQSGVARSVFPYPEGETDLDGRPLGAERKSFLHSLEECPYCGYAARDISSPADNAVPDTASAEYRALCADTPASRIQRAAFLLERGGNFLPAAEQYLHLAWLHDDTGSAEEARRWRGRAIAQILAGTEDPYECRDGGLVLLLTDLLRRSGEFEMAADLGENAAVAGEPDFGPALRYECWCADHQDAACHTGREAEEFSMPEEEATGGLPGSFFRLDGMVFAADVDAHGRGWLWDPGERVLTLGGYHGSEIEISGDVKIVLEDNIENVISGSHGACLCVREGNLTISGRGDLLLSGADAGVAAENGNLTIACSSLTISGAALGISAGGQIRMENNAMVNVDVSGTGLRSETGGLYVQNGLLTIRAEERGVDLAESSLIEGGMVQIDCVRGTALQVRHGTFTMRDGGVRVAGSSAGVLVADGQLLISGGVLETSAETAVQVTGALEVYSGILYADGSEGGVCVEGNVGLHGGELKFFGSAALRVSGELQMSMGNLTAEGDETGAKVAGLCTITGGQFQATGRIGLSICEGCVWTGGIVSVSGVTAGIHIEGRGEVSHCAVTAYAEEGAAITVCGGDLVLGMDGSGNRIVAAGKTGGLLVKDGRLEVLSGSYEISGRTAVRAGGSFRAEAGRLVFSGIETGLEAEGDVYVGRAILEVSGEEACVIRGKAVLEGVILQATGERYGLRVRKDVSLLYPVVTVTGSVCGIISEEGSVLADGGSVSVSCSRRRTEEKERSCGVCTKKGNVLIRQGIVRISGDSCAVEVCSSSKRLGVSGGMVRLMSPGCGASVPVLDVSGGLCTVYGKREGAVVSGGKIVLGDHAVVSGGRSERAATSSAYVPGMRYLQVRFEKDLYRGS